MTRIMVNKNTLSSSVSTFESNVRTLNQQLDNLKNCLNGLASHNTFDVTTKAGLISSSVGNLKDNFNTEAANLKNYVSSVTSIDEKDPMENIISISSTALKTSTLTDVNFDNINYNEKYKNPAGLDGYRLQFVESVIQGAIDSYKKYGVLPSLTLAQAILESGWGQSGLSANYNNLFGIKAGSSWTGRVANLKTSEQNSDGSYYQITAGFRAYDSPADSIEDHAKLLTNDRYKRVLAANNYREACVAVRECGYATSLNYSNSLISLIEKYGLDQWDKK